MRKITPILMLLAGLWLLLYPIVCQKWNAALQQQAVAAWKRYEADTDLLGYLTIPKLSLILPVREGTDDAALAAGVGLLEGTQFGTHAVLCGHRGLPEAILFRDLDQLQPGDTFSVTLAAQTRAYQVLQVLVVTPEEVGTLQPEPGRDLCTLLTCTPYGINSHRLLIRGELTDISP